MQLTMFDELNLAPPPECIIVWENVPGVLSTSDNAFGCFLAELAGETEPLIPEPCPPAGKTSRRWKWKKKTGKHSLTWPVAGLIVGPKRTIAWRTLDAQFFGVAQRRRRVFVVASARDDFDPSAVLFEFDGVRRDNAPSREAQEDVAVTLDASLGRRRGCGQNANQITGTLNSRHGSGQLGTDFECSGGLQPVAPPVSTRTQASDRGDGLDCLIPQQGCWWDGGQLAQTLDAVLQKGQTMPEKNRFPAVLQPIAFSAKDHGADAMVNLSQTLRAGGHNHSHANAGVMPAVCVHGTQDPDILVDQAHTLGMNSGQENALAFQDRFRGDDGRGYSRSPPVSADITGTLETVKPWNVATAMQVRRLTPRECERLQYFPDDYTRIPVRRYKFKKVTKTRTEDRWEFINGSWWLMAADGPRYKAIGNSWAVCVPEWIGWRIDAALNALDLSA